MPRAEPARTQALASYGEWALRVVQVWTMVRERKFPPMGGEGWWDYRSDILRDLYESEHDMTHGLDYADALEGVLIANREANTDPAQWAEVWS